LFKQASLPLKLLLVNCCPKEWFMAHDFAEQVFIDQWPVYGARDSCREAVVGESFGQ